MATYVDVEKIGKRGGENRAKNMTAEERSAAAKKAARARWGKRGAKKAKKKP